MRLIEFELYSANKGIIKCSDPQIITIIRENLSVVNKNASFIKKSRGVSVDRLYCITLSGRFDIGLFNKIKRTIDNLEIDVQYKFSPEFRSACVPQFPYFKEDLATLDLTPYDYQQKSVERMLKFGRGVILIGTGGGKTFIMSLLTQTVKDNDPKARFLVIVPTIQLVEQTYADFLDYGFTPDTISRWSGSYDFQDSQIIVASSSILQSKLSDLSFLKKIDVLMVDEVHILKKGNLINKIIDKMPTNNRFGFTGTLPEEIIDEWNVLGKIGPILFEKDSDSLRNEKVISQAEIDIIKVHYNHSTIAELHSKLEQDANKYAVELDFMVTNEFRNKLIVDTALVSRGNSLIMVDRIEHGEILSEMLKQRSKKKRVYFIQGEVKVDDREKVREIMEEYDDVICVAISKIFSTGINIKNIHNIVFATPGKAKVKLIQSIGRGLRLHTKKQILRVYDFADNLHYSNRHLAKREVLYASEKLNYEIRQIKEPN